MAAPSVETNAPAAAGPAPARERVLRVVACDGPVTVGAVAAVLHVSSAAARKHLDALLDDGLVQARPAPVGSGRGRGRPARRFVVTEAGHQALPDGTTAVDDLAVSALDFLAETAGAPAVSEFARRRAADLERRHAGAVEAAGPDPADRARALARALTADGFAASVRPVSAGPATEQPTRRQALQLCQGHCPVQHAAARFPELCEAETRAFERLLGVGVQRLATLARGEHVCTTHLTVRASGNTATDAHEPHEPPDERTDS